MRRRVIALLLIGVSLLMLAVPVFPHHHHRQHADVCLLHDICAHGHDCACPDEGEQDCEQSGCVSTFFAFESPGEHPVDRWVEFAPCEPYADSYQGLTWESPAREPERAPRMTEPLPARVLGQKSAKRAPPIVLV